MLISQDVIRRDMLKVKDGENTKALPLLEELLRYGRKHSEIVILEGILNAEWYRALFELAVALYGKNIYASINEQIQNIAQKKDTLCRRMYN